jgi:hypothetical protein
LNAGTRQLQKSNGSQSTAVWHLAWIFKTGRVAVAREGPMIGPDTTCPPLPIGAPRRNTTQAGRADVWVPKSGFEDRLLEQACAQQVAGTRGSDLQIGLIAYESGARQIWTHDSNFAAFPCLKVLDPLGANRAPGRAEPLLRAGLPSAGQGPRTRGPSVAVFGSRIYLNSTRRDKYSPTIVRIPG